MKKILNIIVLLLTCFLAFGQSNQWIWSNGQLVYGMPISSIDSLTYNDNEGVDTLLLPRKLVHIVYDTIFVRDTILSHDTIYTVTTEFGDGVNYHGDNYAHNNMAFKALVSIDSKYKISIEDVEVTMNNYLLYDCKSINNNLVSISIPHVRGNIHIKVNTAESSQSTNEKILLTSSNANLVSSTEMVATNQTIGGMVKYVEAGTRGIYTWDIPAESIVTLTVTGGGSYGMALTDMNGNVLEFFTNNSVAASAETQGTYIFAPQRTPTKLHVSKAKFVSGNYTSMNNEMLNGMSFAVTSDSTIAGYYVAPSQTIGTEVKYNAMNSTQILISAPIPANCYTTVTVKTGGSYGFAICNLDGIVLEYFD